MRPLEHLGAYVGVARGLGEEVAVQHLVVHIPVLHLALIGRKEQRKNEGVHNLNAVLT